MSRDAPDFLFPLLGDFDPDTLQKFCRLIAEPLGLDTDAEIYQAIANDLVSIGAQLENDGRRLRLTITLDTLGDS